MPGERHGASASRSARACDALPLTTRTLPALTGVSVAPASHTGDTTRSLLSAQRRDVRSTPKMLVAEAEEDARE